jgi:transposase-like protein
MLDGMSLGTDLLAIVALGIALDGTKHLLDFELGATENAEVAKALLARLTQRGFQPAKDCRLLCVEDGSKALLSAVQAYWPDAVIQRCLVHKERNLRGYLSKRDWGELARLMKRLRQVEGADTDFRLKPKIAALCRGNMHVRLPSEIGMRRAARHWRIWNSSWQGRMPPRWKVCGRRARA